MEEKSFIKYLLNKIDSKFTIVSKLLLLMFICSLLIPIPNGTTTDADVMTKLLTLYLNLVTTFGTVLVLFLAGTYFDFILGKQNEKNKFKLLLTSIIIGPIISYVIYLIFNIITPFQFVSMIPTLALFTMYVLEFVLFGTEPSSHFKISTFNFTKIKRIF